MSTPDSIKAQIQNLISTANATTGKSDTNLTTAITSLISGYGGSGDVTYNGLRYNEGTSYIEMVKGGMIINHNCGFVPDIFILYPKFEVTVGSANEEVAFIGYYGSLLDGISSSMNNACFVLENRTSYTDNFVWQLASSQPNIPDTTTPITETQIRLPYRSANYIFRTDVEYGWIAISEDVQSDDYDFWEIYQQGGSRTDYSFAFNGTGWTDDVFKPKYIIKPIIAQNMLSNGCKITVINDENFDFSECTNAINLCYLSPQIREANIDISNITNFTGGFYYCSLLNSITLRNINNTCTFANSFYTCASLVNFNMTGAIGKSISFANSPLLSNTSIQNIIDGLEDLTGQTTQTITFHKDVKAKFTEEQIATITSKNWTLA